MRAHCRSSRSSDGTKLSGKLADGTVIDTNKFGVAATTTPGGAQISANGTYAPRS